MGGQGAGKSIKFLLDGILFQPSPRRLTNDHFENPSIPYLPTVSRQIILIGGCAPKQLAGNIPQIEGFLDFQ